MNQEIMNQFRDELSYLIQRAKEVGSIIGSLTLATISGNKHLGDKYLEMLKEAEATLDEAEEAFVRKWSEGEGETEIVE